MPISPAYALMCQHTVTVYNVYKDGSATKYHKTIFDKSAYLEVKRVWQESQTGTTAANSSLLVIPQGASGYTFVPHHEFDALADKTGFFTLRDNDKAVQGVGPDIATSTEWAAFIPSKVSGLMVVKAVDPKKGLLDEIVHIEAGG